MLTAMEVYILNVSPTPTILANSTQKNKKRKLLSKKIIIFSLLSEKIIVTDITFMDVLNCRNVQIY